jgi:hypothetical protein
MIDGKVHTQGSVPGRDGLVARLRELVAAKGSDSAVVGKG